jgi:formate dehydrogenase major subunit
VSRRLREGARLVVVDPRRIDLMRTPHVKADHHLQLQPGSNVAVLNAMGHVIATESLIDERYVVERCDPADFSAWFHFVTRPENSPEAVEAARALFETSWGVSLQSEPGLRILNMLDAAVEGSFKGLYIQGEDIAQSDPNVQHVTAGLAAMECVVIQDLFLNETASYAHVFLPGSSFPGKDGTFTNAERRINRVRRAIAPLAGKADWETTMALSNALGYPMSYDHPSEIVDEIARLTPTFAGVSYARLDELGSIQWPCNEAAPEGTPIMHVDRFVRGRGRFVVTEFVPTDERTSRRFPLILTTGRILSQYNVGAQTSRTENVVWHQEDVLEIHPHDAENRGIRDGDWVALASRAGETSLRARFSDRVQPGVAYTTFHHAETGANVVTTGFSDWATNCPEYKVTAVEVRLTNQHSAWQDEAVEFRQLSRRILGQIDAAE